MRKSNSIRGAVLVLATLLVSACASGPSTSIVRAERLADIPDAPYRNVLVVGVANDQDNARRFENALADNLIKGGAIATAGSAAGMGADITAAAVRSAARQVQANAVIVTSVKQADVEAVVNKGQTDVRAERKDGNLANFFRYDYKEITAPVEVVAEYDVLLETKVYDAATGEIVYVIESRTIKAETPFEVVMGESRAIADKLQRDSIVK